MKAKLQHTPTIPPNNLTPQLAKIAQFRFCYRCINPIDTRYLLSPAHCCARPDVVACPFLRSFAPTPPPHLALLLCSPAPTPSSPVHPILPTLTRPRDSVIQPSQHRHIIFPCSYFSVLSKFNFYCTITSIYMQCYMRSHVTSVLQSNLDVL